MESSHLGKMMPVKRLRVRVPCYPLRHSLTKGMPGFDGHLENSYIARNRSTFVKVDQTINANKNAFALAA